VIDAHRPHQAVQLAFSRDSRRLAVGERDGVLVYDLEAKSAATVPHSGVTSVGWAGSALVVGSEPHHLSLYPRLHDPPSEEGDIAQRPRAIVADAEGTRLGVLGVDRAFVIDKKNGRLETVASEAFRTNAGDRRREIAVQPWFAGPLLTGPGFNGTQYCRLDITPKGIAARYGSTETVLPNSVVLQPEMLAAAMTDDCSRIALVEGDRLSVWDVGDHLAQRFADAPIQQAFASSDGKRVVTIGRFLEVAIWEVGAAKPITVGRAPHATNRVRFDPGDSRRALLVSFDATGAGAGELWFVDGTKVTKSSRSPAIVDAAFIPQTDLAATARWGDWLCTLRLGAADEECWSTRDKPEAVYVSPDGEWVAAVGQLSTAILQRSTKTMRRVETRAPGVDWSTLEAPTVVARQSGNLVEHVELRTSRVIAGPMPQLLDRAQHASGDLQPRPVADEGPAREPLRCQHLADAGDDGSLLGALHLDGGPAGARRSRAVVNREQRSAARLAAEELSRARQPPRLGRAQLVVRERLLAACQRGRHELAVADRGRARAVVGDEEAERCPRRRSGDGHLLGPGGERGVVFERDPPDEGARAEGTVQRKRDLVEIGGHEEIPRSLALAHRLVAEPRLAPRCRLRSVGKAQDGDLGLLPFGAPLDQPRQRRDPRVTARTVGHDEAPALAHEVIRIAVLLGEHPVERRRTRAARPRRHTGAHAVVANRLAAIGGGEERMDPHAATIAPRARSAAAVATVLAPIGAVLGAVESILEAIESAVVVARVAHVLPTIAAIFTPIRPVLGAIEPVLGQCGGSKRSEERQDVDGEAVRRSDGESDRDRGDVQAEEDEQKDAEATKDRTGRRGRFHVRALSNCRASDDVPEIGHDHTTARPHSDIRSRRCPLPVSSREDVGVEQPMLDEIFPDDVGDQRDQLLVLVGAAARAHQR
jgi:hypothetical protein